MPMRNTKQAPPLFKGEYRRVSRFIEHYCHLLEYYQVTSDRDQCRGILEYCSQEVEDFILACPDYIRPNWEALKEEILKYYDAERMETRIQLSDLIKFLQEQVRKPMTSLSQWKKYSRKYLAQAGFLNRNQQLDDVEMHAYFWYGIPENLRNSLEVKLQTKYPTHDNSKEPWTMTQIQTVAEVYFQRNTYSDKLYHLPALGIRRKYDDEDDDEDENDEDEDEDDYEEERRARKKKKLSKKKTKTTVNTIKGLPSTQILKEELSRRIIPPSDEKVEDIINQLNTMSLDDTRYGYLYYKAVKDDNSGLIAQCINRRPVQANTARQVNRDPLIPQNQLPQNPIRPPYQRGTLPHMTGQHTTPGYVSKCYGCFDSGHRLRDCPKLANLIHKGVVLLNRDFKYQFPDGQVLYRRPEESLVQTIERMRPSQHQVQYVTLGDAVEDYYSKAARQKYQPYANSDESESDSESESEVSESDLSEEEEEDVYEEGHWSWRSQRRQELPTFVAYEAIDEEDQLNAYQAYPVERGNRVTRQTRTTAMNEPIRNFKNKFDGVLMPPRKTREPEKNREQQMNPVSVPEKPFHQPPSKPPVPFRPKENILPVKAGPIPVDARKPRNMDIIDVDMKEPEPTLKENREGKKPIHLQDYPPQSKTTDTKPAESQQERTRIPPRQSELSAQVDSKAVVRRILDTEVSIPLRDILATSKELSYSLEHMVKYKNPYTKPTPSLAVFNSSEQNNDANGMEEDYEPDYEVNDSAEDKALIKLNLTCNGKPITAVIDTGSQLNIVSEAMANQLIQLPINLVENVVMGDANGNSGRLEGLIKKVPLRCGEVLTEANLYIGRKNLPFDLLLGRPWQKRNKVSIDERKKGTYLVFKDQESDQPKFEVFINPAQLVPRTFKPFKNVGVYAAIETAEDGPSNIKEDSTTESNTESPTDSFISEDLIIETEADEATIRDLLDRLKKFIMENEEESQEENLEPSSIAILAFMAEKYPEEKETEEEVQKEFPKTPDKGREKYEMIQEFEYESEQEDPAQNGFYQCMMKAAHYAKEQRKKKEGNKEINPEADSGEISAYLARPKGSQDNPKDNRSATEFIAEDPESPETRNHLCPKIEEGIKKHPTKNCQCKIHQICECTYGNRTESLADKPLECQENQNSEPEYSRMETSCLEMEILAFSPKADTSIEGKPLNTICKNQTKPDTNIPAMSTTSTAYTLPVGEPIHPDIDFTMNDLASIMARAHAQAIINQTDYSYTPPAPLKFEASPVLLATNNLAPEEGPHTPFAYAELVSQNTKLSFTTNGITHTLIGDAYIQFSYFTADRDGQNFINTFNARPPYPPDPASTSIITRDAGADPISADDDHMNANLDRTDFPPIVIDNSRSTSISSLHSSTPCNDHEAEPQRGQHGGEFPNYYNHNQRPTTTTDPPEEGKDELSPPDGRASVFFAAVADPIVPHDLRRLPLPSRLRKLAPAPIITIDEHGHGRDTKSKLETKEIEDGHELSLLTKPQSAPGTSFFAQKPLHIILTNPEGHLRPPITVKTPSFILAYGPFVSRNSTDPLHPFEYHVYLHYIPTPLETPSIAYGNFPHVPITYLDLESKIDEDFIAKLDKEQLVFILLAIQLHTERHLDTTPDRITINPKHLVHGWIPPTASNGNTLHYRYPLIETLLSLAAHLIHDPHGRLANSFQRYHTWAVKELSSDLDKAATEVDEQTPSHPNSKLESPLEHHSFSSHITSKPDYVLAYGPFITPDQSPDVDHPFIYRVYLQYLPKRFNTPLKFVYGNYHAHPINYAFENFPFVVNNYYDLENNIGEGFIAQLGEKQIKFLEHAIRLYTQNSWADKHITFDIDGDLLTQGWTPPLRKDDKYIYYRYSPVETLLSLATRLLHEPHGQLAEYFQKYHGDVAREWASNPNNVDCQLDIEKSLSPVAEEFFLPSVDHDMTDTTMDIESDDTDDDSLDIDEPINLEASTGWDSRPDEELWSRQDTGWGIKLTFPNQRLVEIRSNKEAINTTYTGPCGVEPGILAYGPFNPPTDQNFPEERDYRLFIHSTPECDVLDYFAYGGNGFRDGKTVNIFKLPISTSVTTPDYGPTREHEIFLHQFEAYLSGDERYRDGVKIPDNFLIGGHLIANQHDGHLHYRYPIIEQVMSRLAARCSHSRLSHPFGRLQLTHIRQLASPEFPTLKGTPYHVIFPPDLPYIRANYGPNEERHPEDAVSDFIYFGCLPRKFAYAFLDTFPKYAFHLLSAASSTFYLLSFHADPATQPKVNTKGKIDWDDLLEPHSFREIFPFDKPNRLLSQVSPNPEHPNHWVPRLAYILQCTRQINQLIRLFESFFKSLGFEGLRDVVELVDLNIQSDYIHNMLLESDEVVYFTALYDFFLREHALNLAQFILRILHVPFQHPFQLGTCRDHIVNAVEPPIYSYIIRDFM